MGKKTSSLIPLSKFQSEGHHIRTAPDRNVFFNHFIMPPELIEGIAKDNKCKPMPVQALSV